MASFDNVELEPATRVVGLFARFISVVRASGYIWATDERSCQIDAFARNCVHHSLQVLLAKTKASQKLKGVIVSFRIGSCSLRNEVELDLGRWYNL